MSANDEVVSVMAVGTSGTYAEHLCGLTPGAAALSENEVLCQQRTGGMVMRASASADYPGYFDITYSDSKYDAAKVADKLAKELKSDGNASDDGGIAGTDSINADGDAQNIDPSSQNEQEYTQDQSDNQNSQDETDQFADENANQYDSAGQDSQENGQQEY